MSALDSHFNEVYGITCAYGVIYGTRSKELIAPQRSQHRTGIARVHAIVCGLQQLR